MSKSIAIAYSMKKKAKKCASGGTVKSGDPEMNYSKGGEVAEHQSGKSGLVRTDTESNQNQRGVNQHGYKGSSGGTSMAGAYLRDYGSSGPGHPAKKPANIHKETLSKLKSMKGPHGNYAEGGEVSDPCPHCGEMPSGEQSNAHELDMVGRIMNKRMMSKGGMIANEEGEGFAADEMPNEFDDLVLRDGLEEHYTGSNSGDELGGPFKDDLVARAMLRKKAKR
jgi:hypothetical protein